MSWANGYEDIDRDESHSASAYFDGPYDEDHRPSRREIAREELQEGRRG